MENESVFPTMKDSDGMHCRPSGGITKREYFAAMAMQGMVAGLTKFRQDYPDLIVHCPRDVAEISSVYADALISVLDAKTGELK